MNKRTSFIKNSNHDIFINFNYTTTLEDIYDIPEENIIHIHGVVNSEDNLVLGHSNLDKADYFNEKYHEYHNQFDEQSAPIYNALAEYCFNTYKDVNNYIHQLYSIDFNSIERVMIIGHSLGTVDLPYFIEIKERMKEDTEWYIYYYDESQIDKFKEQLSLVGVNEQQVHFVSSTVFYDYLS